MIFVNRTPEPPILTNNAIIWLNDYRNSLNNYNLNPNKDNKKNKKKAENKYNHKQIKDALINMFSGKCAYCESHIAHVDYGNIEHFKPKSKFVNECFNWDNLLLSCTICNTQYKRDLFPTSAENGPLIDPTYENPSQFLRFEFDSTTGTANVFEKNQRGITTKDLLGLNRPDLVRHRSKVVRMMVFIAIKASGGDIDAYIEIKRCCSVFQEYSAFAKELCDHFNLP
jgi:uncharacterized protein (TIGR02646 family)